jgi:hypothetical protein
MTSPSPAQPNYPADQQQLDQDSTEPAHLITGRNKPEPTNGRPMPGTRLKIPQKIRDYRNRAGVVADYEWDWNSHLFPVLIPDVGMRLMTINDVEIDPSQCQAESGREC